MPVTSVTGFFLRRTTLLEIKNLTKIYKTKGRAKTRAVGARGKEKARRFHSGIVIAMMQASRAKRLGTLFLLNLFQDPQKVSVCDFFGYPFAEFIGKER